MKLNLSTNIKHWYMQKYPFDELGEEIRNTSFLEIYKCIDTGYGNDIYSYIFETEGEADSIIRERIFEGLAEIFKSDYSYIYDKWLQGAS
tara:strand:+ start:59 stop:328 length:270 start_codon:yes stop_codon:yes gene_type:complete